MRPYLIAVAAAVPLLAPEVWSGFRVAQSDAILSVIAPTEQPLSARGPGAPWAMVLALTWFSLAYWRRDVRILEALLVVIGGAAVLARLGNAWLFALAMLVPLGRQLARVPLRPTVMAGLGAICVGEALLTLVATRPPGLPASAQAAALAAPVRGAVLADWRWASDLQRQIGSGGYVFASGGLTSEASEFWADYVRIAQGHERWAELLRARGVDLLVLDSNDQQRETARLVRDSSEWRVAYDRDGALVAQRVGP
jgi:hypothetical protein